MGIAAGKYHDWTARYGSANEHNVTVPRDGWLEPWEEVCLHSAIGYVTPADKLAGRDRAIFAERDRKLEAARQRRKAARQAIRAPPGRCPTRSGALR
jgi:hypothetical protein